MAIFKQSTTSNQLILSAEKLAADPRVQQAKELLQSALAEHQTELNQVRTANPKRKKAYDKLLKEFADIRGGGLYFPYISSGLGNGPFVELADGSVKLDFISGIGVHGFGHSHPALLDAGIDAALCDTVMQGNLQQNAPSIALSELLLKTARQHGSQIAHCFLSTSGAMANENALKLVFQKHAPADRILAFRDCFAGRTLALAQLTDRPKYRDGLPVAIQVDQLTFFDAEDPAGSTQRTINEIRHHAQRFPGKHAAIWIEPIQGEGGYYPGDVKYFQAICQECQKLKIAIIMDEVQTFARTTQPFAFSHFQLDSLVDVVTIGKITQVCATLFTDAYKPRAGLISQTFTGSSWAIMAARTILQGLIDRGNFSSAADEGLNIKLHRYCVDQLQRIAKKHPGSIRGPYGLGGMLAFTPLDGSSEQAKQLCHELFDAGLMSFVAGGNPARIRFLMPLGVVTTAHIDLAAEILERVIAAHVSSAKSTKKP
jgi:acetylornithine aminotransferase